MESNGLDLQEGILYLVQKTVQNTETEPLTSFASFTHIL